jgi:hypothetical protein
VGECEGVPPFKTDFLLFSWKIPTKVSSQGPAPKVKESPKKINSFGLVVVELRLLTNPFESVKTSQGSAMEPVLPLKFGANSSHPNLLVLNTEFAPCGGDGSKKSTVKNNPMDKTNDIMGTINFKYLICFIFEFLI